MNKNSLTKRLYLLCHVPYWIGQWILSTYKLGFYRDYELLLLWNFFYLSSYCKFLYLAFFIIVSHIIFKSLYLVYSANDCSPKYALLLDVLFFNVLQYFDFIIWKQVFSFFSLYHQPYPTFGFHLVKLLFNVPLVLLLVGDTACFVYLTTAAWDGINAVLGHVVFCWGFDSEVIFSISSATPDYCPDIIWTTYLLELFGSAFDIRQTDCSEFWGMVLWFEPDFLEPMLSSLGSYCDGSCLISYSFVLYIHQYHY